jgi:hypothetical protein
MAQTKKYDYYENPLMRFLNGNLVVEIKTTNDMIDFCEVLKEHKMNDILRPCYGIRKPLNPEQLLWDFKREASINSRSDRPYIQGGSLFFEFLLGKGFTFGWDRKAVVDWIEESNIMSAKDFRKYSLELQ